MFKYKTFDLASIPYWKDKIMCHQALKCYYKTTDTVEIKLHGLLLLSSSVTIFVKLVNWKEKIHNW